MRPFVCSGSPLGCDVFIVGCNPATAMDTDFWSYWRVGYGFDKDAWLADYKAQRRSAGKRDVSPTRRAIEVLVESCRPLKCLETNVFAEPTERQSDLSTAARSRTMLAFLVSAIGPRWIISHGAIANAVVEKPAGSAVRLSGRHLRLRRHDELRELGRRIALDDRTAG
jgi:hypothetical protein